jgi:hypothetical protein
MVKEMARVSTDHIHTGPYHIFKLNIKTMFVFRKIVFKKLFFKFFYVCLSLEKLVNRKYFPIKEKFGLVFKKVFFWKIWAENTFWKLWKI